jgi:hypothetical protein
MPPNRQTLAGRTGYDLYNSLTYTAKKLHANSREVLEQTAYALLLGKVSL